ncbi:50S ribosomal protein L24 [Patescibacteria group bacterium]|nr:50S ribosomal protein L24 [Patescibacteria group bacterium]
MKIKKGDNIIVLSGKDKGRTGQVLVCFPKKNRLIAKGLNMFKKHVKASQNQAGGIIEKERSLLVSKVALICPQCQKKTRIAYTVDKSGKKYRRCRRCQAIINSSKADK